jgi:hypothetical protein
MSIARPFRHVAIAGFVMALLVALPAFASTASAAAPPASTGWARFGHFAPEQSAVDVYVDGAIFVQGLGFKSVSEYAPLASGPHRFEVRPSDAPESEPLLDVEASVPEGASITVGAVSTRDGIAPQIYTDELVQPPADQGLVRFVHTAPDVAAVDVAVVGGPVLAADVPYPDATAYLPIAPGTYDVEVRSSSTDELVLRVTGWSIQPGVQASIVIVRGADGAIDVVPVTDAVAAPLVPAGGIQTGGGAMADVLDPAGSDARARTSLVILGAVAAMTAASFGLQRRRLTRVD